MRGVYRLFTITFSLLLIVGFAVAAGNNSSGDTKSVALMAPRKARVEIVTDTLHGQQIADPYRWLENGDSAETQQFVKEQLAYTKALLGGQPVHAKIRARLDELFKTGTVDAPHLSGPYLFYTQRDAGQNQPVLYVRQGVKAKDRELVNANTMSADGTVALDWWQESKDGRFVAFGTSPGGLEISTLRVIETATGKVLAENIDRTRAASVAWLPDNSGFYYTKLPRPGDVPAGQEMYNRHVFFHRLGTDPDGRGDEKIFGQGRSPQEWPNLYVSDDGRWLVIMANVTFDQTDLFIKDLKSKGGITPIIEGKNFKYDVDIRDGQMYILTNEDSPHYRLMKVAAEAPAHANWKELIPQTESVLKAVQFAGDKLLVEYEQVGASALQLFSVEGTKLASIPMPTIGNITGLGGSKRSDVAFFGFNSYTTPPAVYSYNVASGKRAQWAKVAASIDPDAYVTRQVFYTSKDGTRVPMYIVHKKDLTPNGKTPTLLAGYGGFNIARTPSFTNWLLVWLEAGGIWADAGLRGGNEYGEQWHKAGMLARKQNVFDDFIAAGEFLIKERYTDKEHLAIYGRSNGGLLTGAVMTQRPDLVRAVVCGVPLLDMLRYHQFQIAQLWIPEYGSAEDPEQFRFISAYSPYQHVKEETLYPATLFFTSDGDTRVDPLHARKMTARLQAAALNGPDRPILLRIEPKAGHGAGKPVSKQVDEWADIFTFLFWQLGMK
jgi:prolyl oligopeptidase